MFTTSSIRWSVLTLLLTIGFAAHAAAVDIPDSSIWIAVDPTTNTIVVVSEGGFASYAIDGDGCATILRDTRP